MGAMSATVDPKLATAIRNGKARDGSVHAAFTLRGPQGQPLSPETTGKIVERVVKQASKDTNRSVGKLVVFKNLQSFSVEAPAALVERIATEDSIGTAALGS